MRAEAASGSRGGDGARPVPSDRAWRRAARAITPFAGSFEASVRRFGVAAVAAFAVVTLAGAALDWDGSFCLFHLLNDQQPMIPNQRVGTAPLQWPVIAASHLTANLAVLRLLFCALYEVVPLLSLGLCWLIVRRRAPGLMLWPVLGIAVTMLPSQMFSIAEVLLAAELSWPLLLLVLLGVSRRTAPLALGLTAAVLSLHPAAALLVVGVGVAAVLRAAGAGGSSARWLWPAALLAAGLVRLALPADPYDAAASSPAFIAAQLSRTVTSPGGAAALAGLLTGALAVAVATGRLRSTARARVLLLAPLVGLFILILPWATNGASWSNELYMRDSMLLLTLPLAALAIVDGLLAVRRLEKGTSTAAIAPGRGPAIEVAGLVLLAILAVQSSTLVSATASLQRHLANAGPCLAASDAGVTGTPLDSWALGSYAIDMQGRAPATLILDPAGCRLLAQGQVQISYFETIPVDGGWFRLSTARDRLAARTGPDATLTS